jgi:dihydrofolate reductase
VSQVVWHITMSLDGFIAGPDDAMEWAFDSWEGTGPNRMADEVMHSTGAILAGRRWLDAASGRYGGAEGIYGGRWKGPVFVLTHRASDHDVSDPGVTLLTGEEVGEAVETARNAAGDKNLEIFGANLASQCLARGLIDEIVVHVAPVLLGDGVRLYGEADDREQVNLELVDRVESGPLQSLRFRVKR